MANWTHNAIADLKEYQSIRESTKNIPEAIRALELESRSIRSVTYDKTPVMGGTSGREDALIDNIDRRERLKINLAIVKDKVTRMEKGMAGLSDTERKVLERFYMQRGYFDIERLCSELGYEKSSVYRLKDNALKRFTLAMFGIADL